MEWASEFSCTHKEAEFNNAVIRFFPRSAAITALAAHARGMLPRLRGWTYGPTLLRVAYHDPARPGGEPPFLALPWCFFHGVWCAGAVDLDSTVNGGNGSAWDRATVSRLFGLHTHGMANRNPVREGSILAVFEQEHAAAQPRRGGGAAAE